MKSCDFKGGLRIADFDTWLEILKIQRPDIYEVIENELFRKNEIKKVNSFQS